jgi:hypothetical protein
VIWRAIHSAVGLAVTLRDISRRRLVPENDQHEEQLEAACVGTIRKSMAATPAV